MASVSPRPLATDAFMDDLTALIGPGAAAATPHERIVQAEDSARGVLTAAEAMARMRLETKRRLGPQWYPTSDRERRRYQLHHRGRSSRDDPDREHAAAAVALVTASDADKALVRPASKRTEMACFTEQVDAAKATSTTVRLLLDQQADASSSPSGGAISRVLELRRSALAARKQRPASAASHIATQQKTPVPDDAWARSEVAEADHERRLFGRVAHSERVLLEGQYVTVGNDVLIERDGELHRIREALFDPGLRTAAAITLQKRYRGYRQHKLFTSLRRALLTIQRVGFGLLHRRDGVGRTLARNNATYRLQRCGRAMVERRRFNVQIEARVREYHRGTAATNIQKNFKMHSSRVDFVRYRRKSKSASVLSRVMRRFAVRERERQRRAAWTVAQHYVGHPLAFLRNTNEVSHASGSAADDADTDGSCSTAAQVAFSRWEFARRQWILETAVSGCDAIRDWCARSARALRRRRLVQVLLGWRAACEESAERAQVKRALVYRTRDLMPEVLTAAGFDIAPSVSMGMSSVTGSMMSDAGSVRSRSVVFDQVPMQQSVLGQSALGQSSMSASMGASPTKSGGGKRRAAAMLSKMRVVQALAAMGLDSTSASAAAAEHQPTATHGIASADPARDLTLDDVDDLVAEASLYRGVEDGVLWSLTRARRLVILVCDVQAAEVISRCSIAASEQLQRNALFMLHFKYSRKFQLSLPWPLTASGATFQQPSHNPHRAIALQSIASGTSETNDIRFFLTQVEEKRHADRAAQTALAAAVEQEAVRRATAVRVAAQEEKAARQRVRARVKAKQAVSLALHRAVEIVASHEAAATRIQAAARGSATRRAHQRQEAARRGAAAIEEHATLVIQSAGRGLLARRYALGQR